MRRRKFDHDEIIRLYEEGNTPTEIRDIIGAKSTYHLRTIIRKHQRKKDPSQNAKQKPGRKDELVKLDERKVRALQNAGWSAERIFDEFGGRYSIREIREVMR